MKINLLKKELVYFIILLLIVVNLPCGTTRYYSSQLIYEDNLVVTLTTDKIKYNIGEPINITICVTNIGDEEVTVVFPSSQFADFGIGCWPEYIYLWSAGKFFTAEVISMTIHSGETIKLLNDKWEQVDYNGQQVPAGNYVIDGWMVVSNIHADPVDITIVTPEFEIDSKHFYFGKLKFDVENIGEADAINVSWQIYFDILTAPPGQFYWEGMIDKLSVGEVEQISSGFILLGGGQIIIIRLKATNAEKYLVIIRGLFFGPLIWIPRWL